MPRAKSHEWKFRRTFRAHALGWRGSAAAIVKLRAALAEIRQVAKKNQALAADGAVALLTRISPAFDQIDGSSGALGSAVNAAVDEMAELIAHAPLDDKSRTLLLERLWQAFVDDGMGYLDCFADSWGDVCGSAATAAAWADRIETAIGAARANGAEEYEFVKEMQAYYSSLLAAGLSDRLFAAIDLKTRRSWLERQWGFKALVAQGKPEDALRYAEACDGPPHSDFGRAEAMEDLLLNLGRTDEAYERFAVTNVDRPGTNLAAYKRLAAKYPAFPPSRMLADLVASTPGREGKWFATAVHLELYDYALALVESSPADPKTLMRAAVKHAKGNPTFAYRTAEAALRWLAEGYGYEITVFEAVQMIRAGIAIARAVGNDAEFLERARVCCGSKRIFWEAVRGLLRNELD
ncbi:MAG TPA: hypothetical protein VJN22_07315 [Candidatus Eremiobacteraceae bacterium]|nr:hypothetical protein [Candidatus Eremiobacteraceae bacterium]